MDAVVPLLLLALMAVNGAKSGKREEETDAALAYARLVHASRNMPLERFDPREHYAPVSLAPVLAAIPPALAHAPPAPLFNVYVARHFVPRLAALDDAHAALVHACVPCLSSAMGSNGRFTQCAEMCVQLVCHAAAQVLASSVLRAWFLAYYVFGDSAMDGADEHSDVSLVDRMLRIYAAEAPSVLPLFDVAGALAGSYAVSLPVVLGALDLTTAVSRPVLSGGSYTGVVPPHDSVEKALARLASARLDVLAARMHDALCPSSKPSAVDVRHTANLSFAETLVHVAKAVGCPVRDLDKAEALQAIARCARWAHWAEGIADALRVTVVG